MVETGRGIAEGLLRLVVTGRPRGEKCRDGETDDRT